MAPKPPTGKPFSLRPLTRKLASFVELSADEIAVLEKLQSTPRLVRRNREIVTEGRNYDTLFVLLDGIALRTRILRDGRRQVLNIALPGDFIGFLGSSASRKRSGCRGSISP
jgi:CRP-like cAMP-binding protein